MGRLVDHRITGCVHDGCLVRWRSRSLGQWIAMLREPITVVVSGSGDASAVTGRVLVFDSLGSLWALIRLLRSGVVRRGLSHCLSCNLCCRGVGLNQLKDEHERRVGLSSCQVVGVRCRNFRCSDLTHCAARREGERAAVCSSQVRELQLLSVVGPRLYRYREEYTQEEDDKRVK